nr:hypothetical protein GCM10025699_45750 [Microbacterium flavescens]
MAVIIVLSILGAAASLGQPLLVQRVIAVVEEGRPLGSLVWALVALVVAAGLLSGFQHYLLQRTGEGSCSPAAADSSAACCACRSASSTPAAPATSCRASARTPPSFAPS